jgi:hypothetical protein
MATEAVHAEASSLGAAEGAVAAAPAVAVGGGGGGGGGAGAGAAPGPPLAVVGESAEAALARVLAGIKHDDKTITECSATVVFGAQNECFYNKVQVR